MYAYVYIRMRTYIIVSDHYIITKPEYVYLLRYLEQNEYFAMIMELPSNV